MTIFLKQYEQIQIGVRRGFLSRLESSMRRKNPAAFAAVPGDSVPAGLNQSVNKAAAFGFEYSGEIERFALLELRLGSRATRFFASEEVRRLQNERHTTPVQRIGKLEQLAHAFPAL